MGFFEAMMKRACESVEENNKDFINNEIPFPKEKIEPIKKEPFNIEESKNRLNFLGNKIDTLYKQIATLETEEEKVNNYYEVHNNSRFVNPSLVNGGERNAYYEKGLLYILMGSSPNASKEIFEFKNLDKSVIEALFSDGDEFIFSVGRFFKVIKKTDYDKKDKLKKELQSLYQERKKLSSDIYSITNDINNYIFWQRYNIPFKFVVDIKPVHSGLLENSNGCGSNKSTVYHLILKEDISIGRFARGVNDFLCSKPKGRHFYSMPNRTLEDDTQEVVTCKQCLKLLEKYKRL